MFKDAETAIKRIVGLVELCPEPYRGKAFEMLLNAYLSTEKPTKAQQQDEVQREDSGTEQKREDESWKLGIPDEVLPRFKAMASRLKVSPEKLADLFDFTSEPFTFAAIHIDGASNRERTKKVALLVAARSFLATGKWLADWAEIKAMCTHQNCYDVSNFSKYLKASEGESFKKVDIGTNIQTSAKGQSEVEQLIAVLAGASDAT